MSAWFDRIGSLFRWWLQPLLVLAVLALGFVGAMGLSSSREAPPRQEQASYAPVVRVRAITVSSLPVVVRGHGALEARTRIDLIPQVGGAVTAIHPELRAGGRFRAGEVLARVQAVDYELALARARAEVSSASTALEVQRAEAEAASSEWTLLHPEEPVPELVGRQPQIEEAEARLQAARAQVESAELDLARTELRLPFDGCVLAASIDVGQVIAPNQAVGSVYATDVFEVPVPLESDELRWIELPADRPGAEGSPARVHVRAGGEVLTLEGRAVRLEGRLDATSRLARLVIQVRPEGPTPRLSARILPGLFADVEIEGGSLENVTALPRETLREGGVVWVVEDGRLVFVTPVVERADGDSVYVSGLPPGAQVVTSNLEVVTDGMQVRVQEQEDQ